MKRSISLILALALLISAFICIIPTAEGESVGSLKVSSANLQFGSNIYLMIAVDYSDVCDSYDAAKEAVTVKITEKGGNEIILTADDSVAATEGFPEGCVGFKHTTLSAKRMGDVLTIQAYNNGEESGDSVIYSILEYAIKTKSEYPDDETLCAAVDAMLEFGAEAQKAFKHDFDYDLTKNHTIARLVGGAKFENGYAKTILEEGAPAVTATHPDYADDAVWFNTMLQVRGDSSTLSVAYTGKTETYFAAPASAAGDYALDMEAREATMYFYGIEYTHSYASSSGVFTNKTYSYFVKNGEKVAGTEGWIDNASIPAGTKGTTPVAGEHAMDYTITSDKFVDYLKENAGLTDAEIDALTLAEKWELKDSAGNTHYTTFRKEAVDKVFTYDEVVANSTAYALLDAENGYIRYTGNYNFNSLQIGNDIYKAVGAYANGDANAESCFTLTVTLAGDGKSKAPFTFFSLRNNNHVSGGGTTPIFGTTNGTRLGFLYSANATDIRAVYTSKATSYKNGSVISKLDRTDVAVGSPTEFQTYYIVFDLANREMRYYHEGDIDTPVAVSAMPAALNVKTFFGSEGLPYFNGQLGVGYVGYLKTFSVTAGDVIEYMK